MAETKNWKNINNWHWVDKDCFPWSKSYFEQELPKIKVESNGVKVAVDEVKEVKGDADLNQRKGRLISLFDISLKLQWSGSDGSDNSVSGTITVPEVAHDTEEDEYVFDIRVNNESSKTDKVKEVVRKELVPLLRKAFAKFAPALIEANASDVVVTGSAPTTGRSTPGQTTSAPQAPSNNAGKPHDGAATAKEFKSSEQQKQLDKGKDTKSSGKGMATVTVTKSTEFFASSEDVYKALTEPDRVSAWTRSKAIIEPKEGSEFSLFDGHITGQVTKLVPNKEIVQKWRVGTWPAGHYSTVKFEIEQKSDRTDVHLKQTGVPVNEKDAMERNWSGYYWNSIKSTFGQVKFSGFNPF
ncbi:Co-chaperone [Mycoemilia scoparia]|uniref:Co-chaperone n=1 Tax=Mycoemilia scoparia TaxID=417184 RepID=A0A9W7ZWU9_9FUNG|nr:Co-chaperone [Mycoemilia scoparia]